MAAPAPRLILDTNLWISFLLTKEFTRLDTLLANEAATLVFSQELLDEFLAVAQRPKFQRYFTPADLEALLAAIRPRVKFVTVTSVLELCRDPKDNFLLALAVDAAASHLLTGDQDLLVLERLGDTRILTLSDYLSEM